MTSSSRLWLSISLCLCLLLSLLLQLPSPTRQTSTGGPGKQHVRLIRLPTEGRIRGARHQRGQQATRCPISLRISLCPPRLVKMAFTRLIRRPGAQAVHYSAAPSDRPSFSPPFIHGLGWMYNYSVICFESAARATSSTMVRRSPRCRWPLEYY